MAGEHVFEQPQKDRFRMVMHVDMPGGNNSAGESWADALEHASVSKSTCLSRSTWEGEVETVGIGQISDAEYDEIMAGTKLEVCGIVKLDDDPSPVAVNILAERLWNDWSARMAETYRYYGHTQE